MKRTDLTLEDIDPADVVVAVRVELPDDLQTDLDRARDARRRPADLDRQASNGFVDVARRLSESGMTLREVGTVLGVSSQRAGQLAGSQASRRATARDEVRTDVPDPARD